MTLSLCTMSRCPSVAIRGDARRIHTSRSSSSSGDSFRVVSDSSDAFSVSSSVGSLLLHSCEFSSSELQISFGDAGRPLNLSPARPRVLQCDCCEANICDSNVAPRVRRANDVAEEDLRHACYFGCKQGRK
ncbi:hypothetical protein BRADI_1g43347v3 [Brachypodium distachyon]|uniref:Uncharacterized protein n=1 Tax=Brachypodium distachyon TaxID=15368 RepID=A0A2K2DP42_BRADI|nr:hypothetical protein BRADI_1g43347v3 [Brachypodium distachyon]